MREALIVVWEASDRICGKRLRPMAPILISAMERHGYLQLAPEVLGGLLTMIAVTVDWALREARGHSAGQPRRRSPPSAAIRRSVAVRTFDDWNDPPAGFMEADLVDRRSVAEHVADLARERGMGILGVALSSFGAARGDGDGGREDHGENRQHVAESRY